MRYVFGAAGALVLIVSACSKPAHTEQPTFEADRQHEERPAKATDAMENTGASGEIQTMERKAGTYDPRHDRAPHAGPGAPYGGDVAGQGQEPIDHPVQSPPRPIPAPPLGVPPNTPTPAPQ